MDCIVHGVTKSQTQLSNFHFHFTSLVAQMVKNLLAMQETNVRSLGQDDPLEKEWQPNPIFSLENPMDRGAWWAAVPGVTKLNMTEQVILPFHSYAFKVVTD